MNSNELRIGNLLLYKADMVSVAMVGEFGIRAVRGNFLISAKFSTPDLEPIYLTEEWLVRFGFLKSKFSERWIQERISEGFTIFDLTERLDGFELTINSGEFCTGLILKYVHQLQNLYFALTGQELEIKKEDIIGDE